MKTLTLTRGLVAIVDDEDYESLNRFKWHATSANYAVRAEGPRRARKTVMLHHQVMNAPPGSSVVFRNDNTLDCRKENLLIGDQTTQRRKQRRHAKKTTSKYKGVFWDKRRGYWFAQIKVNYKATYLGSFGDEEAAARAYDEAARELFGEAARLNFP